MASSSSPMEEDKKTDGQPKVNRRTEEDYEKLKARVASYVQLAGQGKLSEALEGLLVLEKQERLAEDITSAKMCCEGIVDACYAAKDWKALNENIMVLSKRRGQLKQAIKHFTCKAMTFIPQTPDRDTKVELISTLQAITEGKIFVEIERARLTKMLAGIYEAEGNIGKAAETLQELAVETFGAMAKTEKISFILDQVRLCLEKKDLTRCQILSKKISPRAFIEKKGEKKGDIGIEGTAIEAPDEGVLPLAELKLRYYELMIQYHTHSNNYLEVCRCYCAMYDSPIIQEQPQLWMPILRKMCWYVVLAPCYSSDDGSGSDRLTLLRTMFQDKRLVELPMYKQLLNTFITSEVVRWSQLMDEFGEEMAAQHEVFGGPVGEQRREVLRTRVTEHNILVVSKFYRRVHLQRLALLVDLPVDEAAKHVAELVVAKAVAAKIDRPQGVVTFKNASSQGGVLSSWGNNIRQLLDLVERSCQQIQKEAMLHKVQVSATA